mgnify:CR=1 FL=1
MEPTAVNPGIAPPDLMSALGGNPAASLAQLIQSIQQMSQAPLYQNTMQELGGALGGAAAAYRGQPDPAALLMEQRNQQMQQMLGIGSLQLQMGKLQEERESGLLGVYQDLMKSPSAEARTMGYKGILQNLQRRGLPVPEPFKSGLLYGDVSPEKMAVAAKLIGGNVDRATLGRVFRDMDPGVLDGLVIAKGQPGFYEAFGLKSPLQLDDEKQKRAWDLAKLQTEVALGKFPPAHVQMLQLVQRKQILEKELGAKHPEVMALAEQIDSLKAYVLPPDSLLFGPGTRAPIAAGGPKPPEAAERTKFTETRRFADEAAELYSLSQKTPSIVPSWGQRAADQESVMGLRPRNLPGVGPLLPQMGADQREWFGRASLLLGFVRRELIGAAGTVPEAQRLLAVLPNDPKALEPFHVKLIGDFYAKYGQEMEKVLAAARRSLGVPPTTPPKTPPVKLYRGGDGIIRKVP